MPQQTRTVRVFICSTFRDMQEERNELAKRVFPQLRKMCEERGVTFTDVDLRWGVTDEEAAEGKVLPICLAEIERCRPFFIGLLGERYGWIPKRIPDELIESQPWLREHQEKSITELEIIHGVLRHAEMGNRALFYFRDPAYVDKVPADQRASFIEQDPQRRAKLQALKTEIHRSGLALREGYGDPQALGELVLRDLTVAINQVYPSDTSLDPRACEAADHEAFARNLTRGYLGRIEHYERLDEHVRGAGPPLVVVGEPGIGKSALLANWASRYHETHPDLPVVTHFIGVSANSTLMSAMMLRIVAELNQAFGIDQTETSEIFAMLRKLATERGHHEMTIEITPEDPYLVGYQRKLFNLLSTIAEHGRVILVIDALDRLAKRDKASSLLWLPHEIPANIRLVVSALPGQALEELDRRGWPTLTVEPLPSDQRKDLIRDHLARYTKTLSAERVERVAAAPQAANPLYLRMLLEELRLFGEHEALDERIDHYLDAHNISELHDKLLERYEEDYERARPGLVREAMTLIWASRRGLPEAYLLDLLGSDGAPLPQARWSPLALAAEHAFVSRAGLIGFANAPLSEAVRARYLSSQADRDNAHLRLADYSAAQVDSGKVDRGTAEELPWQLSQARSWQRLYEVLADTSFAQAVWAADELDLKTYWGQIESQTCLRMEDAYRPIIESPVEHAEFVRTVGRLLAEACHREAALPLFAFLVDRCRELGDPEALQACLSDQAIVLTDHGDLDAAMPLYEEQKRICRETGNRDGLQTMLGNQARILYKRDEFNAALAQFREQELICREIGNLADLTSAINNQAMVLLAQEELVSSMECMKRAERIIREIGDLERLQYALHNQAYVLEKMGRTEEAIALYREAERMARKLGNRYKLQGALGNLASVFREKGESDKAILLYTERAEICRDLDDKSNLINSLTAHGTLLLTLGDYGAALGPFQELELISREIGDRERLQMALGAQGVILRERGAFEEALTLLEEADRICRELGSTGKVALLSRFNYGELLMRTRKDAQALDAFEKLEDTCRETEERDILGKVLTNMGACLARQDNLETALQRIIEAEQIARELGDRKDLIPALSNKADILREQGDPEKALTVLEELERLLQDIDDKTGLHKCLGKQAQILAKRNQLDKALVKHEEAELICRKCGDMEALQKVLANQAEILHIRGDLKGAIALHKKRELFFRETRKEDCLQESLFRQANLLQAGGKSDEAMALFKEQEKICRKIDDKDFLAQCLGNQALILVSRGDLNEALRLYKEEERIFREIGNNEGLLLCLGNQAALFEENGDVDAATGRYKEQEQICRRLPDKAGLLSSLGGQARILQDGGDLDSALSVYREGERVCRELGDKDGLLACLAEQIPIVRKQANPEEELTLYRALEPLCRELDHKDLLRRALGLQAGALLIQGDMEGALAKFKEHEQLCREQVNKEDLGASLQFQAEILEACGDLDGALAKLREHEQVCRELRDRDGFLSSLNNQMLLLNDRGDAQEALAVSKKAEKASRKWQNMDGLLFALQFQATVLRDMGNVDGALQKLREHEQVCRESGDKKALQACLKAQGGILAERGELEAALALHSESELLCREIGHTEGLASAMANRALVLRAAGAPLSESLRLAGEAYCLAREHGHVTVAQQVMSPEGGLFQLPASRIGLSEGAIIKFAEKGQITGRHSLWDVSSVQAIRSVNLIGVRFTVLSVVLGALSKMLISSVTWSWVVCGLFAALASFFLVFASLKRQLRIDMHHGVACYDVKERTRAHKAFAECVSAILSGGHCAGSQRPIESGRLPRTVLELPESRIAVRTSSDVDECAIVKTTEKGDVGRRHRLAEVRAVGVKNALDPAAIVWGIVTTILAIASMMYIPSSTWSRIVCAPFALLAVVSFVFGLVKKWLWIETTNGVIKYEVEETKDGIADGFAVSVTALLSRREPKNGTT